MARLFRTNDGAAFIAASDIEVLEALRNLAFWKDESAESFAKALAARVELQTGRALDISSPAAIVADLIAQGLLAEERMH